jgi:hypothetical protein
VHCGNSINQNCDICKNRTCQGRIQDFKLGGGGRTFTACRGGFRGGAPGARPPLNWKKYDFWRKIVIFHTKYLKNFAPPSAIEKKKIFWRKIVIFHTKYPKNFMPPSARGNFLSAPNTYLHTLTHIYIYTLTHIYIL